jgi:hypothetical protein
MPSITNTAGEDVVAARTDELRAIEPKRLLEEAAELGAPLGSLPGGSARRRLVPW